MPNINSPPSPTALTRGARRVPHTLNRFPHTSGSKPSPSPRCSRLLVSPRAYGGVGGCLKRPWPPHHAGLAASTSPAALGFVEVPAASVWALPTTAIEIELH